MVKYIFKNHYLKTGIIFVFFIVLINTTLAQELKIVSETNQGITIQYSPKVDFIDTLKIGNSEFLKIHIKNTALTGESGEPQIPIKVINIGIPLEADIKLNIVSNEFTEIDGKLLPSPKIDLDGIYFYKPNSAIYGKAALYPQKILLHDKPAFVRNQRITTIKIKTVQYSPASNRIKILDKIVFNVSFIGDVISHEREDNIREREFYQGLIMNFSQSERWLKKQIDKLSKRTAFYQQNNWYKIFIKEEGIYKISGSDLENL